MEILSINHEKGTCIIKEGINIHTTKITPEIQKIITKNTKPQNKQNTKKTTKKQDKKTTQKTKD